MAEKEHGFHQNRNSIFIKMTRELRVKNIPKTASKVRNFKLF